ncbi:hypothetical protein BT93_B0831 [Corymbia citriodora subsp. variegata]|nr:hypothetical protein BT93_B0831 [Corymbia citriodora subsp. variegata]
MTTKALPPPTTPQEEEALPTDAHAPQQVQELKALAKIRSISATFFKLSGGFFRFFNECLHPDEKRRLEMSKRVCSGTRGGSGIVAPR